MALVGIICEYNPLHLGHWRQMEAARGRLGPETAVVCLMSGNYVQRGEPAIFSKEVRARAAVSCGADLVLELPVTVALSSAEGFADGGVELLTRLGADWLCFGAESGREELLWETARRLLDPAFSGALRDQLQTGRCFPVARQRALESLGGDGSALTRPNDILGVEYCKAILRQGSPLRPLVLSRPGDYHSLSPNLENPSATALRRLLQAGGDWRPYVPAPAADLFAQAELHTMQAGERAVLARLRALQEEDFARLPGGSEGLWRRVRQACRTQAGYEGILQAVKTKRYTRTRLTRLLLCAYLGLSAWDLQRAAPYVRALAFNRRGAGLLRRIRQAGRLPVMHGGEKPEDLAYYALECRCRDLYGLFAQSGPEPAGLEEKSRVYFHREGEN